MDKPYRVYVDTAPVFGPTSGHWGPTFRDAGDFEVWADNQHIRKGTILRLYRGEREVSRQTVK